MMKITGYKTMSIVVESPQGKVTIETSFTYGQVDGKHVPTGIKHVVKMAEMAMLTLDMTMSEHKFNDAVGGGGGGY